MKKIKIGILREEKTPPDKRVPLTPDQCASLIIQYNSLEIIVQPSPWRAFTDEEYRSAGIPVSENLEACDILLGVKEVPPELLIPEKTYLFFSHTIKKQPYNRELLRQVLKRKIRLIDYEVITDLNLNRLIGFGRYAGIVGAYNGIRAYGIKHKLYYLKPAHTCTDRNQMNRELEKVKLPPVKIIITGSGRVARGARELLTEIPLRQVTPLEIIREKFLEPVFAMLYSRDYHEHIEGKAWDSKHFYAHPEEYISVFHKFAPHCDLLIHAPYWDPRSPKLFSTEDMLKDSFRINVIADITCDINGSVPATIRPATIEEPFYDYDPGSGQEARPFEAGVTVMAVDNLPCELPADASADFGEELINKVIPSLLVNDEEGIIARATITEKGKLTERFAYLADYVA